MDCFPQEFDLFGADDVEMTDWSDPISDHPLNDGLVMWLLAGQGVPGGFGGDTWRDLCRRNNGVLTNMDPATDWVGGPNGFGALDFDGTSDVVVAGTSPTVTTNRITVSAWLNPTVLTRGDVVTRWVSGASGADQFNLLYGLTSGKPQFYISTGAGTNNSGVGSNSMTTGKWHHIVGTYDGSTIRVYLDGVEEASAASSITMDTTSVTAYRIGDNADSDGDLNGKVSDARVHDRVWSATEVREYYNLSRQGYPGLLNRVPLRRMSPQVAAGGATNPKGIFGLALTGPLQRAVYR